MGYAVMMSLVPLLCSLSVFFWLIGFFKGCVALVKAGVLVSGFVVFGSLLEVLGVPRKSRFLCFLLLILTEALMFSNFLLCVL